MANGNDFISDLEFEGLIKGKGDRELLEFTARQTLDLKRGFFDISRRVHIIEIRSTINRWTLIILVITLITLGILDSSILRVFGV